MGCVAEEEQVKAKIRTNTNSVIENDQETETKRFFFGGVVFGESKG